MLMFYPIGSSPHMKGTYVTFKRQKPVTLYTLEVYGILGIQERFVLHLSKNMSAIVDVCWGVCVRGRMKSVC